MQLEQFRGNDLPQVVQTLRRTLGEDAVIVRTQHVSAVDGGQVEVLATTDENLESFRRSLDGSLVGGLTAARRVHGRRHIGPYVLGLVGPAGAGKTTTAVKLALNPEVLGTDRVGILTLDTYRVAAFEQLATYAEVGGIPLEIAYHAGEVQAALERMRDLDVVIVDTPGRPFESGWGSALAAAAPAEVHLVAPAGTRIDVLRRHAEVFGAGGLTHLLLTKADEVPNETGLAEIAASLQLPTRWIADGVEVPDDIGAAVPRIMRSLGRALPDMGTPFAIRVAS